MGSKLIKSDQSGPEDSDAVQQTFLERSLGERFEALLAGIQQARDAVFGIERNEQRAKAQPPILAAIVLKCIALRSSREKWLGSNLFSDPAWDLLLLAFASSMRGRRMTVTEMSAAAKLPSSTSHRWLNKLEDDGLIERRPDDFDGRLIWIHLTAKAEAGLIRYFSALSSDTDEAS